MSYCTYINGTQIFGNNEYYPEWIEFIRKQGIEVDEEGGYDGTDNQKAIDEITAKINEKAKQHVAKIIYPGERGITVDAKKEVEARVQYK